MRKHVLVSVMMIVFASSGVILIADESKEVLELRRKIKSLEDRVAKLEEIISAKENKDQSPPNLADLRERVKKRFEQDQETYSQEELKEIERLYQVANKEWNSPEAKVCLKALIEKYPKANRTGCALQYLGQMSSGEEKEKYLKQAIEDFGDCYYGSGVQVGAYARLYLADYYQKNGKKDEASALYEEIRKHYPDAVNHKGKLLKDIIPK